MALWFGMMLAALAQATDPCERIGVVTAPDPVSGLPAARGVIEITNRVGAGELVHHAWSLLGSTTEVVVVIHLWLTGERTSIAPAGWPMELHAEGARPLTLRSRSVVMPSLIQQEPPITEVSPRFRLDAITARWLATHSIWRIVTDWDGIPFSYGLKGTAKRRVQGLMACAATLAPEELPELRGLIVELKK